MTSIENNRFFTHLNPPSALLGALVVVRDVPAWRAGVIVASPDLDLGPLGALAVHRADRGVEGRVHADDLRLLDAC